MNYTDLESANKEIQRLSEMVGVLQRNLYVNERRVSEAFHAIRRYSRLRVLGCAPYGSKHLERGEVMCFQSLDAFLDADIKANPSRGEAS